MFFQLMCLFSCCSRGEVRVGPLVPPEKNVVQKSSRGEKEEEWGQMKNKTTKWTWTWKLLLFIFPTSQNLIRKLQHWKNLVHINTSKIATSHTQPTHPVIPPTLSHCGRKPTLQLTARNWLKCSSQKLVFFTTTRSRLRQESGLCV